MKYAVFCMLKNDDVWQDPSVEPLAYGRGEDPEPHLLLRRKRVSLFDTREAAEVALTVTLVACEGMEFVRRFRFVVLECE